ncbi:hypothetical protein ZWY2020_020129, partial [Hordeum vulgare]
LPEHDPSMSRFFVSPRDGKPEMGDSVPGIHVVPPLDLNATSPVF